MNIVDYIPYGRNNAIKRRKLEELTGLSDRHNRELIMKARNQGTLILNMEDGKGYFRPILPEELDCIKKAYDKEAGRNYASGVMMELLSEVFDLFQ